jgi:hypothetical protein
MEEETCMFIVMELAFLMLDTLFLEDLLTIEFRILQNLYLLITMK